ncbi:MAG: arginine--tRNA ligase [Flavobacteriaceae bacterium]|nr:arginine--tRNA ligase [Flavobacteriaceae bacterium]MBT5283127.1 arginine--tRNA ligase [Flavobacteriaceae bacterium]MBT5447263.1 arginine--tRNA ligase [Flavobacteriaceae bacterium]MBT5693871.1 arginine--tRNA ligase [Flavobacteriaceae bacterium]MBT5975073.1 arginine--tRNA ligase [Flavobacteriaceae bacterium]
MNYSKHFTPSLSRYFEETHQVTISDFEFQSTRKEFSGDLTLVVFPLLRQVKARPEIVAEEIGNYLVSNLSIVEGFNVVKGFLNLVLSDLFYINQFSEFYKISEYGHTSVTDSSPTVMVEFSSPNTNKPLHLGHIRNNVLGYSVAKILEANGKRVIKTQIINDRGIHICKSMVAWEKFGNQETPESSGLKGDQLVGKYYVKFDKEYKKEVASLVADGQSDEEAKLNAPLLLEAQEMLRKWEANDTTVVDLWETMNQWVYKGFEVSYKNLGVSFDSYYYESDTYLLGKDIIEKGLSNQIFYKKEDGSVWVDLTEEGLDEKLLLRADGTSVYMTQDLGTAQKRLEDVPALKGMVYTVGNEQDYHFKVLFLILKKLGFDWANSLYHLSYGMVDLPSGKMKSREGTVVDADDLIKDMVEQARTISEAVGKLDSLDDMEKDSLFETIALGALKYYILKVDPKKRILFDPEASIDFNGNTGPFIQYTHARIKTLIQRADFQNIGNFDTLSILDQKEREVIKQLGNYPEVVTLAGAQYSPALIANYIYDLVKSYNTFYQNVSVLGSDNLVQKNFRIALSQKVAEVIYNGCGLLGINVPNRM